jgi:hypothetical protein
MIIDELFEAPQQCPECGGISFSDLILAEKKDACYYKVKASAKVWPSAYASGRLVQCRKKGSANYGNKSESVAEEQELDEKWSKKYKSSINCANPKGFSQKAHCAGRNKNESVAENVIPVQQDSELLDKQQFATNHYSRYANNPEAAFDKWVQRSLMHSEQDDEKNVAMISQLQNKILNLEKQMSALQNTKAGVAEDTLDEKSVSQAQFRTMAGAAHNPEFARKVGISQDVAQDFNQADKKSNYKKLPTRANEGGAGSGRPDPTSWDTLPGKVGRVEKTATGLRHHADPSRYGGTIPEPEHDKLLTPQQRWRMDKITQPIDDMDEGEQQKGADYRDPKEVDYDDEYDAMVARVKRLAGLGPMKTVYDPAKRVYRNMPTAQQPKK